MSTWRLGASVDALPSLYVYLELIIYIIMRLRTGSSVHGFCAG